MKKKLIAIIAVGCTLLTGCEGNNDKTINVQYSDMFKAPASSVPEIQTIFPESISENNAAAAEQSSLEQKSEPDEKQVGADSKTNDSVIHFAIKENSSEKNAAPPLTEITPDDNADKKLSATENNTKIPQNKSAENQQSEPSARTNETNSQNGISTRAAVPAGNRDIADTPIDGVCYIPYKSDDPEKDNQLDHGYRVIFRTDTDTYLLGVYPYKFCEWNEINRVCQEIENLIDIECQMVGVPSLSDIELLSDSQMYIPGQFEMWTSTPTSPTSTKAYYRNKKGSYHPSKEKSSESGVCAIIKVSTAQNDETLLSASWTNYNQLKTQLEAEEAQYILDTTAE